MITSTHTQGTPMPTVGLTKVTDVKVAYGNVILEGTIKEVHGTWFMIKIQAVTDRDGVMIPEAWMVGREMPFAISDRIIEAPKVSLVKAPAERWVKIIREHEAATMLHSQVGPHLYGGLSRNNLSELRRFFKIISK